MKFGNDYKKTFLISSILYLLLGVVLLFFPQINEITICYAIGAITIFMGILYLIVYFARPDFDEVYRLDFVYGIVFMALGIYAIAQPVVVAEWLYLIVGIAICIDSLIKMQNAIDLKRLHSSVWWAVLLMSLVTATMGIMLLFAKTYAFMTSTQFIGISLIVDGVINIISFSTLAFNLSRLRKAKQRAAEAATLAPQKEEEPEETPEEPTEVPEKVQEPEKDEAPEEPKEKKKGFFSMLHEKGADETTDEEAPAQPETQLAEASDDTAATDDSQTAPELTMPEETSDKPE